MEPATAKDPSCWYDGGKDKKPEGEFDNLLKTDPPQPTHVLLPPEPDRVDGVLSDEEIVKRIIIRPMVTTPSAAQPIIRYGLSSYGYDFRLGFRFAFPSNVLSDGYIDPKEPNGVAFDVKDIYTPFVVKPKTFFLAESLEYFEIPRDVIGLCYGKSTLARCGIILNVTPLEPTWKGKLTLEIYNCSEFPVRMYPGEGIGQIVFFSAKKVCKVSYEEKKGLYQNQSGLTFSRPYIEYKSEKKEGSVL